MVSELPLLLYTVLGGLAAGLYAGLALFPQARSAKRPWFVPALALALLACGGIALLFHLGHAERMLNAFRNIQAGITQEGYITVILGIIIVADLVYALVKKAGLRWLEIAGGIAGILFMLITSNAYFKLVPIAALHSWETFALFLASDLAMGFVLAVLLIDNEDAKARANRVSTILAGVAALAMLLEGLHYSACGVSASAIFVGAAFAVAAAACALLARKYGKALYVTAFALVFVAATLSRYGFYLAI